MKKRRKRSALTLIVLGMWCVGVGCADAPAIIQPRGPAAADIATLWWITLGMGTVIYVVVMGFFVYAVVRGRRNRETGEEALSAASGRKIILWGGAIAPAVILITVYAFTLETMLDVAPPEMNDDLVIEIVGHQYWWEVRYPNQNFITANEIHVPVGQPVQLKLTSDDVIHSFWVPELHGKHDLIPGRTNTFWIQADEADEYWGICTEYCGIQHAKMLFLMIAQPPEEFEAWLAQQQEPAAEPSDTLARRGKEVYVEAECGACHRIDGVNQAAELGPDLTHFGSRRTLGAGILENTRGNLAGWLADPQAIKQGNVMPASRLSGEELQALVAYLESLK